MPPRLRQHRERRRDRLGGSVTVSPAIATGVDDINRLAAALDANTVRPEHAIDQLITSVLGGDLAIGRRAA